MRGIRIAEMIVVIISVGMVLGVFIFVSVIGVCTIMLMMPRIWMIVTHDAIFKIAGEPKPTNSDSASCLTTIQSYQSIF